MSQKRQITCDRCGAVIIDLDRCGTSMIKEYSAKIHYWGVGAPRSFGEQRIDLCTECAEKFVRFIENTQNEDPQDAEP